MRLYTLAIPNALRIIVLEGGYMEIEIQHVETLSNESAALAVGLDLANAFAAELDAIGSLAVNRLERMGDLRQRMDAACDVGDLTIREWRILIDKVAAARSEMPLSRPGPKNAF